MTEQEQINAEVQTRLAVQDEKFDAFLREMKDFKDEMRQQNEMRAAENVEIRNSIKEIYLATDAKIAKIESNLQNVTNHIQILTVTAMAGIAAIAIAVFLK